MKQTPEGNWIADIYISKAGAYDYLLSWTSSDGSLVEMVFKIEYLLQFSAADLTDRNYFLA
jgi:hypothetical protein